VDGHCDCSSLEIALQHVKKDTLINITLPKVALSVHSNISYISMIGITGNNGTFIDCNNTGGVSFFNCDGIDISGIAWYQCGSQESHGAILLDHSHDISIRNCKFQSSNAYGITVESLLGRFVIIDTEFSYNNRPSMNGSGGLLIHQLHNNNNNNPSLNLELVIIRSLFKHNGVFNGFGGMGILTNNLSSLINISIKDSNFIDNIGSFTGGMYVFHNNSNLNAVIQLENVNFVNNTATVSLDFHDIGIRSSSAFFFYTNGNSTNFTMINSSAVYNSFLMYSDALYTSVLINKSPLWSDSLTLYSRSNLSVSFSYMNFTGAYVLIVVDEHPKHCILKFDRCNMNYNSSLKIDGQNSNGFQCYITNCQFSNNNISTISTIDIQNKHFSNMQPFIQISNTSILNNTNTDRNIMRLVCSSSESTSQGDVQLSSVVFAENSASEGTLYVCNCKVKISDKMSFSNNTCKRGAGIYFANYSHAILSNNADIEFINNVATIGGGAIYAEHPPSDFP